MANWIFVMTGDHQEFKDRIKGGNWPIFSKTHHRNEIRKGDHIVFYLGGKPNKNLIGTASLSSGLSDGDTDYFVSISNVDVWKRPLQMKELVGSLSFIKNKDNWGIYLQGGITPLPPDDYDKILSRHEKD